MPAAAPPLKYGPRKYASLHLILSRWLRHDAERSAGYIYVTLGGTELRDIQSLRFIDSRLTSKVFSYEEDAEHYKLALRSAERIKSLGLGGPLRVPWKDVSG